MSRYILIVFVLLCSMICVFEANKNETLSVSANSHQNQTCGNNAHFRKCSKKCIRTCDNFWNVSCNTVNPVLEAIGYKFCHFC